MIKKAKENSKNSSDGEYISDYTRGQILIHAIKFFETDAGKWGALTGELAESAPTKTGVVVQPVGTKVKIVWKCHGDYPMIGYEAMYRCLGAVFNPDDDKELKDSVSACLGGDESGLLERATKEGREHPCFGARGFLVGFVTKPAKSSEERKAKGLHTFTDFSWSHVEQTADEVMARAKKLPEVS